jgi:drug/metabolite transporter (DMT)-like permease
MKWADSQPTHLENILMIRGAIFGLAAAAIWGGMYVVSDVVLATIPPFTLLTIRLILGAAVLALILWRQSDVQLPKGRDALRLLAVGMLGFGLSIGMQFVGTDKSTAINGSLVTTSSPAFILLFAVLILREKLTLRPVGAVTLATLGVLVIINPLEADFGSETFIGDVALTVAAVTWALYSVLVRQVSARFDTLVVTLLAFLGGMLVAVPAMIVELGTRPIGVIDGGIIVGILYLGVISTAVAMWLWNRAFALVDASAAALFFFAQPLVGALLSVLFLGQRMTLNLWVGGLLVAIGVLLSLAPADKNRRPADV